MVKRVGSVRCEGVVRSKTEKGWQNEVSEDRNGEIVMLTQQEPEISTKQVKAGNFQGASEEC